MAFVATVYGVGLANVVLLPAATKIKARIESETALKQLKLEGVVAIVEGHEPQADSQQAGSLSRRRTKAS